MSKKAVTRREFVATAGTCAIAAFALPAGFPTIVPRHVLGGRGYQAPSDTLNVAVVGVGGQGSVNAQVLAATENIVAVCDVDLGYAARNVASKVRRDGAPDPSAVRLQAQFDRAPKYSDFREMLDTQRDIDAIVVATPDHLHGVIAHAAMTAGKHVYVQKPLTWSVHEARVLRETALKNPRLVTQMGNQGHSSDDARLINEWIHAGLLGPVRDVYAWTNRPVGFWPQGIPRPAYPGPRTPGTIPDAFGNAWSQDAVNAALGIALRAADPAPAGLRWDLYLGPVAEDIPYHPIYHPFNWRGWVDFGVGALGDMGAHLIDQPFWALGLGLPASVEATSTAWGTAPHSASAAAPASPGATRRRADIVSYPVASTIHYRFAARGTQPPVTLSWFDGGLYPPRPEMLPDDVTLKSEGGVIFIGEKGILVNDTYGANPRMYPPALMDVAATVPRTIPRVAGAGQSLDIAHMMNWVDACKGGATTTCPFEYAARLTETILLGIVALRAGPGRRIDYDGDSMRVTNIDDANQFLTREYRAGWAI